MSTTRKILIHFEALLSILVFAICARTTTSIALSYSCTILLYNIHYMFYLMEVERFK